MEELNEVSKELHEEHEDIIPTSRSERKIEHEPWYMVAPTTQGERGHLIPKPNTKPKKFRNKVKVVDPLATLVTVRRDGVIVRRRPTEKQVRALHFLMKGHSKRKSMMEAGYSESSASGSQAQIAPMLEQGITPRMKQKLQEFGVHAEAWAAKFKEWKDAKDIVVTKDGVIEKPDYQTQVKAYDRWATLLGVNGEVKKPGMKRKMTIEEYTFSQDSQDQEQGGEA